METEVKTPETPATPPAVATPTAKPAQKAKPKPKAEPKPLTNSELARIAKAAHIAYLKANGSKAKPLTLDEYNTITQVIIIALAAREP